MKNGHNSMCYMLIFVKSKKKIIFENCFDKILKFLKILPYTLTIKVLGLFF